jgi:cytochrome c553
MVFPERGLTAALRSIAGVAIPFLVAALAIVAPQAARAQDVEAGREKAGPCQACHGPGGNSTIPLFPSLAGQTARYLYLQLRDYQEGRRHDPQMDPIVAPLSRQDLLDLAAFFAAQKPRPSTFNADPQKAARGQKKSAETLCPMCHLREFMGQNEIPRVAGQQYDYIVKQMRDFKTGKRTNDAGNMASVSKTLSDDDIDDLAHYLVGLH